VAAIAAALLNLLAAGGQRVAAESDLTITTPFPSVVVQPGADVQFELTVDAADPTRVDLGLEGLPDGWSASLSGGGNEVQAVFVTPDAPATVNLTLDVAPEAAAEPVTVTVVGEADDQTARLDLQLLPAAGAGGTVNIEPDIPSVRGTSEETFDFNVTLQNDTPQELVFTLEAVGPQGWEVSAEPSADPQAASLTVGARNSEQIAVSATPPPQATAGVYPVRVEAASGEYRAATEVLIELTGSVAPTLTTPDERLSTTANAGSTNEFDVVLVNDGTAPIEAIDLSGTGPGEWEVVFEPATVDQLPPQETLPVTARITPSANAVAGDYVVTLTATSEGVSESIDVRVTVETSPIWGLVGAALILLTLGGLVWVFRRYGRR